MATLVSSSTHNPTGTPSFSVTVTKPSGVTTDDVLFAQFSAPPNSSLGTPNFTSPDGWFLVTSVSGGTLSDLNLESEIIWCKVATNSEPANYTWSDSVNDIDGYYVCLSAWRGVDTTAPILALYAKFTGSNGNPSVPAVGPTVTLPVLNLPVTNATALLFGSFDTPVASAITPPSGSTSVYSISGGTNGTATLLAYKAITTGATSAYSFVNTSNGPFAQKVGGCGLVVVLKEAADTDNLTWVAIGTGGQDLRLDNGSTDNFYTLANNNTQRRSRADGSVQIEVSSDDIFEMEPDRTDENLFGIGISGYGPVRADTATLTVQATGSDFPDGDSPIYGSSAIRVGMTGTWSEDLVFYLSYYSGLFALNHDSLALDTQVSFDSFFTTDEIDNHFPQFFSLDVDANGDVWVVGAVLDQNISLVWHVNSSYTVTRYTITSDLGTPVFFGTSINLAVGYDASQNALLIGLTASGSSSTSSPNKGGTKVILWDITTHTTINTFTSTMGEFSNIFASLVAQTSNSDTPATWISLNTGDDRTNYGFTQKINIPDMTLARSINYPPWGYFVFQAIAFDVRSSPDRLVGWFVRQAPTFFHWANAVEDYVLAYVDIPDEDSDYPVGGGGGGSDVDIPIPTDDSIAFSGDLFFLVTPTDNWLALPVSKKIYLVQLTLRYVQDDAIQTEILYLSNHAYNTRPNEDPPNREFIAVLLDENIPSFNVELSEVFFGLAVPAFGALKIHNADGQFDSKLPPFREWEGGEFLIQLTGDRAQIPLASAVIVSKGVMGKPTWDDNSITIELFSIQRELEKTQLLSDTFDGPPVPGDTVGQKILYPELYGYGYNLAPILRDETTLTYVIARDVTAVTAVYDNGVALTPTVQYTVDLPNGEFTLNQNPAGQITCDAEGRAINFAFSYLRGDFVYDMVIRRGGVLVPYFSLDFLVSFNTLVPGKSGIYFTSQISVLDAVQELLRPVLGSLVFDRLGFARLNILGIPEPTDTPYITLNADYLIAGDASTDEAASGAAMTVTTADLLYSKVTLQYSQNLTVQTEDSIGSTGAVNPATDAGRAKRAWLKDEWRTTSVEDTSATGGKNLHPTASELEALPSYFVFKEDADYWAAYILFVFGKTRQIATVKTKMLPLRTSIYNIIALDYRWLEMQNTLSIAYQEDYGQNNIQVSTFF